jgi:hypothetical protein
MRKIIHWLLREYDFFVSQQWGPIGSNEPGLFTVRRQDGIDYIVPRKR